MRLQLKGQPFKVYSAATYSEISAFWETLLQIDSSLSEQDTTKHAIKSKSDLQKIPKALLCFQALLISNQSVALMIAICANLFYCQLNGF